MAEEARDAIAEAREIREGITSQLEALTHPNGRNTSLHRYDAAWTSTERSRSQLTELINRAIGITRADMGNIQIYDPSVAALQIEAQIGFDRRFLDFFNRVHAGQAACGTVLRNCSRVIVEDITESPIFVRTDSLEVMLDARARAVQSTPIIGTAGRLLGVFSTHYERCHHPSERDLRFLDLLARQASRLIEARMLQCSG